MRYRYPISSKEILDQVNHIYDMQYYILSYPNSSGTIVSNGIYDTIEASGASIFSSGVTKFSTLYKDISNLDYIKSNLIRNQR